MSKLTNVFLRSEIIEKKNVIDSRRNMIEISDLN
jgi:hypothetical protein